jgi:hypothetical protein
MNSTAAQRFVACGPRELREKDDFYPTPPEGTEALLSVEKFDGPIWEPACGAGDMSRVLETAGYEVVSTDLVARGYGQSRVDFLMESRSLAPNIVTNPPFKLAEQFATKAISLAAAKVCLLVRIQFLEGASRRVLFNRSPLARVWVFSWRLPISRGEVKPIEERTGSMATYAWFVWEQGFIGKPTLGWI